MELQIKLVLFVTVMVILTIISLLIDTNKTEQLEFRKLQARGLLRENIIIQNIEKITDKRVKESKIYKTETLCLQAGYKLKYSEFIIFSIVSSVSCFIIMRFLVGNLFLAIIFLFIGWFIPNQYFTIIRNKRVNILSNQIGSFLLMMLKRYEVTKDIKKSLDLTLPEFQGDYPIYTEIKLTIMEIEAGIPTIVALENMAHRTGNVYMLRFADYFKMASDIGTENARHNLLYQAFYQYDENRKNKLRMKARLSGPKRNAYIALISIPTFALYQASTTDDYLTFMTQTFTGQVGTAAICIICLFCLWFINMKIGKPIE